MEVAVSVEAQLSVEGIAPAAPFLSSVEGAVLVEGPLFTIISTHRDCVEGTAQRRGGRGSGESAKKIKKCCENFSQL